MVAGGGLNCKRSTLPKRQRGVTPGRHRFPAGTARDASCFKGQAYFFGRGIASMAWTHVHYLLVQTLAWASPIGATGAPLFLKLGGMLLNPVRAE